MYMEGVYLNEGEGAGAAGAYGRVWVRRKNGHTRKTDSVGLALCEGIAVYMDVNFHTGAIRWVKQNEEKDVLRGTRTTHLLLSGQMS